MSNGPLDVVMHTGPLADALCEEIAAVAQQSIAGFSDDRPVSASLVRSRLTNALTGAPPVLVLARAGGELVGWCAVRRPEPDEARARVWGPVVAPFTRGAGLGSRLLREATGAVGWPLMTTDVPVDRAGAARFFTAARWRVLNTVTVLHRSPAYEESGVSNAVGFSGLQEYVSAAARRFGGHGPGFADATLQRWHGDARFQPEHLLLDPATGSLLLALTQRNRSSSELLLAEMWAASAARLSLIRAGITLAAREGVATVRAVTRDDPAPFMACGMRITGACHIFAPPGDR